MGKLTAISGSTLYLDANLLIYAMEDLGEYGKKMRGLFARIDSGELRGVTSELSLAEVLVKPIRDGAESIRKQYETMLAVSGPLTVAPVARAALVRAAELRAASSLRLPDALHAATSELLGCTTFVTNDLAFLTLPSLPVLLLNDV
jgi:predicted nucleic acid-binding protein